MAKYRVRERLSLVNVLVTSARLETTNQLWRGILHLDSPAVYIYIDDDSDLCFCVATNRQGKIGRTVCIAQECPNLEEFRVNFHSEHSTEVLKQLPTVFR